MVKVMYCWRCEEDLPMLDEDEFAWVMEPYFKRKKNGVDLRERREDAVERMTQLTGLTIWNFNSIWHHQIKLYGPPCKSCGRVLRTPGAKLCVMCGEPSL